MVDGGTTLRIGSGFESLAELVCSELGRFLLLNTNPLLRPKVSDKIIIAAPATRMKKVARIGTRFASLSNFCPNHSDAMTLNGSDVAFLIYQNRCRNTSDAKTIRNLPLRLRD